MTDHGDGASDPLLQPVFLKTGHTCRNRVTMAAMADHSAPEDGSVGEAEVACGGPRAGGGVHRLHGHLARGQAL